MRQILASAFLSLCLASPALAAPEVNKPAPDFSLKGADGKTYKLSELKGQTVVLEWLNHECPFVKKHYDGGNMQALQKEYTQKKVTWLSVISSAPGKQGFASPEQASSDAKRSGAAPTAVLIDSDGKVGKLYDAKTTPHMFVIDPKGNLAYAGAIDSVRSTDVADLKTAKSYIRAALDEVLAGKPVSEASTQPYGCGVKYN
jgi:peroxiredoxin